MSTRAKKTAAQTVKPGSNNMPTMFDHDTIHVIAAAAFEDKSKSDLLNGTAVQRLACAVYATWLNWVNNGHPDKDVQSVPDLGTIVENSEAGKAAASTLKPLLTADLIGEPMLYEGLPHDDKAKFQSERTAKLALLTRSMRAASILKRAGVTLDMFNSKMGCFAVPPSWMLESHMVGTGRLNMESQPVMLNNRTFSAEKKDGGAGARIKMSIDQLERAYRSNHNMKATRQTNGGKKLDLKSIDPVRLADGVELATLIAALHRVLVPTKGKTRTVNLPNDLPAEAWSMLSDIAQENDAIQDSDTFRAAVKTGITPAATVETAA